MTGSTRFSPEGLDAQLKGKKHKGNANSGGNQWGDINKLLPLLRRGDANRSSQSGGLPYQPAQSVNPMGGGSPVMVLLLVGAAVVGAYFILKHKKKGKRK